MNRKIGFSMTMLMLLAIMTTAQPISNRQLKTSPKISMSATVSGFAKRADNLSPASDCEFKITGYDDFGTGWEGNSLTILEDGLPVYTYTLESGYVGTAYFGVTDGGVLEAVFEGTNFPYKNAYRIYDSNGNLLFEDGMNGTAPVGGLIGTVICNLTRDISAVSVELPALGAPQTYIPKAVLKNRGSESVSVSVTLTIGTEYSSTKTITNIAGGESITVEFENWTAVEGVYETSVCTSLTGDMLPDNDCNEKTVTISGGNIFYAYCVADLTNTIPTGPVNFLADNPGKIYSLAPTQSSSAMHGGCWVDGMWYGSQLFETNLYRIDEISGEMTKMHTNSDMSYNGLAWDGANAKLYGATYNSIYSIDLITNISTLIGPMNNTAPMIGIACNREGELYGIDMGDNSLYSIDPATGNATVIGPLGIELCYIQDMAWDLDNDIMYLAGYNAVTDRGELHTIDPLTGAATLIGPFESGMEIASLAIPTNTVTSDLVKDARVTLVLSPVSGEELGHEKVTVIIKNNGMDVITQLPVSYTINSGNSVTEYIPSLTPGEAIEFTFTALADLSFQDSTYLITVCTELLDDENTLNNCLSQTIVNIAPCLVSCPLDATDEHEACGEDINGGCNMSVPAYGSIENGEIICGTFWFDGETRDTDWYMFTINEPQSVTITGNAEYNYAITLADMRYGCENPIVMTGYEFNKCEEGIINIDINEPGDYVIFVGPAYNNPLDCDDHNRYLIKLDIKPWAPEYCVNNLYTEGCTAGDGIAALELNDISLNDIYCNGAPTSGYSWFHDWTSLITDVAHDDSLSLKVNFENTIVSAWIDFNDNLLWDQDEMVVDNFTIMLTNTIVKVPISIPIGAPAGNHNFRIRSNWNAPVENPCDTYEYGNVIDFVVNSALNTATSNIAAENMWFYPNPVSKKLNIHVSNDISEIRLINSIGLIVYESKIASQINTSSLNPGVYILQATDHQGNSYNHKVIINR